MIRVEISGGDGALDPETVYFQYLSTTTGGGHDPDGTPDSHVRPAHRALHGKIFRLDDPAAPVPPIDFGCRCAMRYVGKDGSIAAQVFRAATEAAPTTRAAAYAEWLTGAVPDAKLDKLVQVARATVPVERLEAVYQAAVDLAVAGDRREVARLVVEALPVLTQTHGN
jgi:hypothetical protein